MKRFTALFLLLVFLSCSAAADPIDLSGMSFDELVALRDQLNLAIWNSQEWQEVTIPAGVWQVGVDIPAGYWTVSVSDSIQYETVRYFEKLDTVGLGPDYTGYLFMQSIVSRDIAEYGGGLPSSVSIDMKEGWFFTCSGSVLFTPYAGKPDLGFR